jgi:NACHT domain/Leucine Rich repeats (2 copies)
MDLLTTLALSIGPVLADSILREWLKGMGPLPELAVGLVGVTKERLARTLSSRAESRVVQEIGKRTVGQLRPLFEHEARDLDESSRTVLALELAATLADAEITADLLVSFNLDPRRLTRHLAKLRPTVTANLSASESALYDRMLAEVSVKIVNIAADLSGFQRSVVIKTLEGQDRILEMLSRLMAEPDAEAAAFERLYRETVGRQLDHMDLFGLRRIDTVAHRQSLTMAYVTLDVETTVRETWTGTDGRPQDQSSVLATDSTAAAPLTVPIDQLLALSRRVVLCGEAGSGKSTFVQWLSVRAAKRDFQPYLNNTVPFFLRLRERVGRGFPAPEEFPAMVARTMAGAMPRSRWVHEQLHLGRALVLVDGIDEIPREQRQGILDQFRELVHLYPLARYVVTSRPAALNVGRWPEWERWRAEEGFLEATLQPMGESQIERLIDQWHRALGELPDIEDTEDLPQLARNLKRLLRQRPALWRLANSPLLCAMICALHREHLQRLPSERLTLYRECCEMLLSRDEQRKIAEEPDYPRLRYAHKLSLLQSFAYWMMLNGYPQLATEDADRQFAAKATELGLPSEIEGSDVRRYFVERSRILREPVDGQVNFTHRTFQEYFAAEEAVKGALFGFLAGKALDDEWRETIILAAGLARPKEAKQLITDLLSKKRPNDGAAQRSWDLALACLETCYEVPLELQERVVHHARVHFPPKNLEESKLVAGAGDLAVRLLAPARCRSLTEVEKSLEALMFIGSERAMTQIASYASDKRPGVQVAISRAWEAFDRKQYAMRVLRHTKELWVDELISWEPFDLLGHLTRLTVVQMAVSDMGPLAQLNRLEELAFALSPATAQRHEAILEGFPRLDRLSKLAITSVSAVKITFLKKLEKLETLSLHGTGQVFDLGPIGEKTTLKMLDLSQNPITSIASLAGLRSLTTLDLSQTDVEDLTPLKELPNLAELAIVETVAHDLSVLARLPKLKTIVIEATGIRRLDHLNLKHVQIKTTRR